MRSHVLQERAPRFLVWDPGRLLLQQRVGGGQDPLGAGVLVGL
jgi:hypothetical protein